MSTTQKFRQIRIFDEEITKTGCHLRSKEQISYSLVCAPHCISVGDSVSIICHLWKKNWCLMEILSKRQEITGNIPFASIAINISTRISFRICRFSILFLATCAFRFWFSRSGPCGENKLESCYSQLKIMKEEGPIK